MKGIGSILLYLLVPQRFLVFLGGLGLGLIVLALPVSLASRNAALGLSIYGFVASIVIPFVLSPAILRSLLANIRLALVPGFKVSAGLALFILHLIAVLFVPLCFTLYVGAPVDVPELMLTFTLASLYSGVAQLMLPSRHLVILLSTLPLIAMYLVNRSGPVLREWLTQPYVAPVLFAAALVGWAYAFRRLARQNVFKPVYKAASNDEWLYYGANWLNNQSLGRGTPAGNLLQGYSDGVFSSLMRVIFSSLLTPLVSLVFLYVMGFGAEGSRERGDTSLVDLYARFFLLLILFSVVLANQGYGEFAARCRFIWLRRGEDRQTQWRLLERLVFNNLGIAFLVCTFVALVVALVSDLSAALLLHFLAVTVSISLFSAYLRIFGRMRGWSALFQHVFVTLSSILLGAGLTVGIAMNVWIFVAVVEIILLVLALLARRSARRDFSTIDWLQVKPKVSPRMRMWGPT
jgi:hypothetical protein